MNSKIDISTVDFTKLINDYKLIVDKISPDCLLRGASSRHGREMFNNHKIFMMNDIVAVTKIMLDLMDDDKYAGELREWLF